MNNKHIPEQFKINSRRNRLELLAGLIDSDGHYDNRRVAYEITQKNERLALDIADLVRSLGFRCAINKKIAKYKSFTKGKWYIGESEVTRLHISGDGLEEIPVLLERKKARKYKSPRDRSLTGIQVEALGEGDYYGFEIDGNRRFLLGDYTVTHNTSLATQIVESLSENDQNVLFLSLDMHDNLLYQRLLQRVSGIDVGKKLRSKIETDENYDPDYSFNTDEELATAFDKVDDVYKNVNFDFTRGCTIESIEENIKLNKNKFGNNLKMVVVDYLEKVREPYSDATANSGFVASRLSDLASTYDIAIMVLLQPQKSAGDPSEELLSMRKVKGASVIEQDLRLIMTLWRPGFSPKNSQDDRYASIAIVKNNMGPVTQIDFGWDGLKGKFSELT